MLKKFSTNRRVKKFIGSVLLFPTIVGVIVIILTTLGISGSSVGIYHPILEGGKDKSLLANKPRTIRSDEWVVNTQMTIAQSNNHFKETNNNLMDGVDMSLILDVPTNSPWQVFRPHNLAYYILPLDNAFSFKWWSIGALLTISVYFLFLHFNPKRRLLASMVALAVFFSPFIQWWYQYITLAPIYYGVFAFLLMTRLYNHQNSRNRLTLYIILLVYVLTSFALIQYPAFQIAVLLVIIPLTLVRIFKDETRQSLKNTLLSKTTVYVLGACITAVGLTGLFLVQRSSELSAISSSAYPGKRVVESGGYNLSHLLSSGFSPMFQSDTRAAKYSIPASGAINQSEASNFILLSPFLLVPLAVVMYKQRKKRKVEDIGIISAIVISHIGLTLWLTLPYLTLVGKFFGLTLIPHARLIMAFGLLNIFTIALFIKKWDKKIFSTRTTLLYSTAVYTVSLYASLVVYKLTPGFLKPHEAVLLALVVPSIVCLLLMRKYLLGLSAYLLFSIASVMFIHPIYQGLGVITSSQLIETIKAVDKEHSGVWVAEDSQFENFPAMAGVRTASGVLAYPKTNYWKRLLPTADSTTYNRYAHVAYNFDRKPEINATVYSAPTADHFAIYTEPCGQFSSNLKINYIITTNPIDISVNSCLHLRKEVGLSEGRRAYIYQL